MARTVRQALRGRSDFISDVYVRDMLYGATVRSPFPHARIRRLDTSTLPDTIISLTAAEIPGPNRLRVNDEWLPILAESECRYLGEPVALLAGPTQRDVTEAMSLIEVEYDELPAHCELTGEQQASYFTLKGVRGEPYTALSDSHQVVEGSYRTGIQEHLYNEPQGAFAESEDGRIVVRTATQWPFHVRSTVAENLAIKPANCVVRGADAGISLDGKLWYPSLVATHVALLSRKSGCPVKLVYSNIEDFQYTPKRAPFVVKYLTGVTVEGLLSAAKISLLYNAGAYPLFTSEMSSRVVAAALSHYACPHAEVELTTVSTNLPPLNVLSGFGMAAAQFALETHVSRLAELAEADPIEWRRINLRVPERSGPALNNGERLERVLRAVGKYSGFARKHAAYELQRKRREEFADLRHPTMGIGVACGHQGSGFIGANATSYPGSVVVRLESEGAAIRTSAVPGSQAIRDGWRAIVSDILGVDQGEVRFEAIDTDLVPDSGPSTLSRNVTVITQLIEQACAAIQRKRFRSPLPIEARRGVRTARGEAWNPSTLSGPCFNDLSFGAAVVETRVDPVTYETSVQNVWLAVDAGRIMNHAEVMRTLEMGVYQALEWATHEMIDYRNGAVDPRSYLSYRDSPLSTAPEVQVALIDSTEKSPNGIGELPQSCVPAALASAVTQATGHYMDQLPTDPALIHGYVETR
jgi:CO/xanthine dehydrogenase Mo-binding subunit